METLVRIIPALSHPIVRLIALATVILLLMIYLILTRKQSLLKRIIPSVLIAFISVFTVSLLFVICRKTDNTDMSFVTDPEVIGTWTTVDYVTNIEDYNPNSSTPQFQRPLFLKGIRFREDGKASRHFDKYARPQYFHQWTKGYLLNIETAAAYKILNLEGNKVLFLEWKSGDYTLMHRKPSYYVLKKVDESEQSQSSNQPMHETSLSGRS